MPLQSYDSSTFFFKTFHVPGCRIKPEALYYVKVNVNKKIILLLITLHHCFCLVWWGCILILYFDFFNNLGFQYDFRF